jgi:hypothetical protein
MNFEIPESIIVSFIEANFPEAKQTESGEWHFNTPFEKDGKLRLYINPEKGRFFDQKRQIGGSFSSFVAEYLDIPFIEVATLLIKEYSSFEDSNKIKFKEVVEVKKEIELPEGLVFFDEKPDGIVRNRAANYLKKRKIDISGLGYIYKSSSEFHNRIFVPFYEENRMVYFLARAFDKSKLRYKNPKNVSAGNVVFNIDKIEDEVFIFEGVFDALSLTNQVSTCMLSNSLKKEQALKILDRMPEKITFVLDNDKDPNVRRIIEKSLNKNIKLLMDYKPNSLNLKIYIYRPPEEFKDFNEYKIATGADYIDYKDCELWNPHSVKKIINSINW